MLLSPSHISCRIRDDRALPTWLAASDEPWVGGFLRLLSRRAGGRAAELEGFVKETLAPRGPLHGVPPRVIEALWAVERRRWKAEVDAPVDPEVLRDVVFAAAARTDKERALATAAEELGIEADHVRRWLFADRLRARVLRPPAEETSPADLVARYNLSLLQSLLVRSMEVTARVEGDARALVAAAKRQGLLSWFEHDGRSTKATLSGPLVFFRDTQKYGRALANVVPALVASNRWELRARVALGHRSGWLELGPDTPLRTLHALPSEPDGRIVRRIARTLRRTHSPWSVSEQTDVLRAGGLVFFPDFSLTCDRGRVFVDVVPFSTPDYLARKLGALALLDVPMIFCVDARFAPDVDLGPRVLRYRGNIDPKELLAMAERALSGACGASPSSCPS